MEKIFIIGPVLAEWLEIRFFSESMQILGARYELEFFDPLAEINVNLTCEEFLEKWRNKILDLHLKYRAFIGFSLGGIILQRCFDILDKSKQQVILFSTPSFSHKLLKKRLSNIITLLNYKSLPETLTKLNKYIYYPNNPPDKVSEISNVELSKIRLSRGLGFVLDIDSRPIIKNTTVNYLHFIGEKSLLVGKNDIVTSKSGRLVIIPGAGMRVLQHDTVYCMNRILYFLNGKQKWKS